MGVCGGVWVCMWVEGVMGGVCGGVDECVWSGCVCVCLKGGVCVVGGCVCSGWWWRCFG